MQRYENYSEIITKTQGKRRYATMYYPVLERKSSDIYIVSKKNDRLDLIADSYYNDSRMWIIIAKANKLHAGTLRIPPGIRLRIPYPLDRGELYNQFTAKQF